MTKAWKYGRWAVVGGVVLQFGGCFSGLWASIPIYLLSEFIIDNNGLVDIFPDGP